ncbi:ribosome assembly cofactor RimP [Apibacter muscae]|uniref:ribosome assembly cofactor RimP n=1 Tax=Apibacter muscae TaxID=2509004 RepID=UPI0011AD4658|nr:ribosome assembly cofactor RimP [Apibacter muscae]TWP30986.1 ribosome assembly cofactor RimP [Apibacter muscae]
MFLKDKVESLIEKFLQERTDIFLISCKISADNKIEVIIDGDEGISIQDCLQCSRAIENNLDREEEDFALSVYSAGVTNPLILPRQYKKNLGRELKVFLEGGKEINGVLEQVKDDKITLTWKERIPKEKGKGKVTVELREEIEIQNIQKATINIKI